MNDTCGPNKHDKHYMQPVTGCVQCKAIFQESLGFVCAVLKFGMRGLSGHLEIAVSVGSRTFLDAFH